MQRRWQGFLSPVKNRILSGVLTLSLVIGGVTIVPLVTGAADHLDLDKQMSIQVVETSTDEAFVTDLKAANVVMDMYRLADAVAEKGDTVYDLEMTAAFDSLSIPKDIDDDQTKALAADSYTLVRDGEIAPDYAAAELDAYTSVTGGVYLILPHAAKDTDKSYFKTVKDDQGNENLVTVAKSGIYEYQFSPIIVSLPYMKDETTGQLVSYELEDGEWYYNVSVSLKSARQALYGDLEITKTLKTLINGVDGTCIFDVEAIDLDGNNVYSNVVSIYFNKGTSTTQTVLIQNIPAGAEVTVTEVYSGAAYKLADGISKEQKVTITAEEVAGVSFVNDVDTYRHGGAITNSFEYVNGEWVWTQLTETTDTYTAIKLDDQEGVE